MNITHNFLSILTQFYPRAEKLFANLERKMSSPKAMMEWTEMQPKPSYKNEDGTAVICIDGPLYDGPAWIECFGVASYERIRRQVFEANLDANVRDIRLVINSPGGTVSGCFETAKVLASSAKPIIEAEVLTMCASAAYLLAATAQKIVASPHSTVGSIGTILTIYGEKGFLAKLGITRTTIVSSVSPFKNDDPEDVGDEGLQRLQKWINDLGNVFVNRVAQLRKVPPETVLSSYGKGGVFVGMDALAAGLIDAMDEEQEEPMADTTTTTTTVTETETNAAPMEPMDSTAMEEGTGPAVEGTDKVGKELDRLKAIDDLKLVGYDDLVYKAKYISKISANELKAQVFDEERKRRAEKRDAFGKAAKEQKTGGIVSANPEEAAAIQENSELIAMAKKAAKHRA